LAKTAEEIETEKKTQAEDLLRKQHADALAAGKPITLEAGLQIESKIIVAATGFEA